jgi:hypothetical protein
MSEPDRTKLPIRRAPFQGVANRTLHGSVPDWDLIGHVEPPASDSGAAFYHLFRTMPPSPAQ